MNIPRLTPEMMKKFPDQTCSILNQIIDYINQQNNDMV